MIMNRLIKLAKQLLKITVVVNVLLKIIDAFYE